MNDLRTAAQQALEAMRRAVPTGKITLYEWDKAVSDLDAALAQQAKPQGCDHCNHPLYAATKCRVCGRVTEQAEPVEPHRWEGDHNIESPFNACMHKHYCMTLKQAEQAEPVAWLTPGQDLHLNNGEGFRFSDWTPLYTAPPQRKPLTDEEIRDLWSWAMTAEAERTATTQQHAFARAIERAHGIGDNT